MLYLMNICRPHTLVLLNSGYRLNSSCMTLINVVDASVLVSKLNRLNVLFSVLFSSKIFLPIYHVF